MTKGVKFVRVTDDQPDQLEDMDILVRSLAIVDEVKSWDLTDEQRALTIGLILFSSKLPTGASLGSSLSKKERELLWRHLWSPVKSQEEIDKELHQVTKEAVKALEEVKSDES